MLIRSTWTLVAEDAIALPRSYRSELIKLLHQRMGLAFDGEIPSVSFSGITGRSFTSGDFLGFRPEEFYQVSLCGLQEAASKAIAELDLSGGLEFFGAKFGVVNRQDDVNSYEGLYQSLVASEPEPPQRFELKFVTPTAFSQGRVQIPLPVPMSMFRSWLERWNHFAPVYLGGDELIGYLGESIVLSRHRIQSQIFPIQQGRVTGFTGEVTLQVLSRIDPLIANVVDLLVHYAQFSGTGTKTRLGMGATLRAKVDEGLRERNNI